MAWWIPVLTAIAGAIASEGSKAAFGTGPAEYPEQSKVPPASGVGGGGAPQVDLSELSQFRQQTPEYFSSGTALGQLMQSPYFTPMKLSDVLQDNVGLGRRRYR